MDPSLSAADRATDLLGRMTTAEKASQLTGILANTITGLSGDLDQRQMERHLANGIGQVGTVSVGTGPAHVVARLANGIQRHLAENTRLGIPALLHNETLNGVLAEGFTSFPTAIGLAATWRPELVEQMAEIIRRQMRAIGIRQALAPVLDVARDARWGRVHETFGEEPLLVSAMGVAYTRGIQGDDPASGVLATAKHFLGYSVTDGGQNMAATHLGNRELYDVFATPFEAAIRLAGLASVMNSYSEIDGVPVGLSREILDELLRGRLGFDGTVVSDYRTIFYAVERQGAAPDARRAAALALGAGLDVELPQPYGYGEVLAEAVDGGEIDVALLDRAVLRVLTQKFALGLFENPYVDADPVRLAPIVSEGRELARELAAESITLLTNRDAALPLSPETESIAVVGPHAESVMAGFANYTYPPVLEMLRGIATGQARMAGWENALDNLPEAARKQVEERMEAMRRLDPELAVREQYGARSLADAVRDAVPTARVTSVPGTGVMDSEPHDIDAAVAAADAADVVILALGGRSAAFSGRATEGEGSDSATLELPARQLELLDAVTSTGKPVIAVLFAGKPYLLDRIVEKATAVLAVYYPGPEGAPAIADVLFGRTSPSGKLPFTVPRHAGQVPVYQGQKRGSGPRRTSLDMFSAYVDLPNTPLFAYGHGLSYTSFGYGEVLVDQHEVDPLGELRLSVSVRNEGQVRGAEVVQVYLRLPGLGVTRPEQQLAAFAKVELEPGEEQTIAFAIDVPQLGFTAADGRFVVDPGTMDVLVGSASDDLRARASVEIVGERTDVSAHRRFVPRVEFLLPLAQG
ncbi:glycoside hydrolase family 3 N-terminal domain-containing protein [Naasia sp. SYSU D00948]|uniref:glycoside hydrolase family 3 N-terminal domain-containing protein n=1 Tax=Naasia sp. SYSU D00948 TaxID=2817379 RepID=UPI001B307770|nr:glycoside hydrolase family 3 N-terminal domain-containing protein [Naasia sp. SYSU D00948]